MDISSLSFLIYAFAGGVVGALILYGLWNKNFLRRSGRHRRRNLLGAPVAGGMSLLLEGIKALKAHRVLELSNRRFQEMGVSTIHMVFPGGDFHITCQPENVKTMLSTDFKRWGLESTRKSTFKFAIGEGKSFHLVHRARKDLLWPLQAVCCLERREQHHPRARYVADRARD